VDPLSLIRPLLQAATPEAKAPAPTVEGEAAAPPAVTPAGRAVLLPPALPATIVASISPARSSPAWEGVLEALPPPDVRLAVRQALGDTPLRPFIAGQPLPEASRVIDVTPDEAVVLPPEQPAKPLPGAASRAILQRALAQEAAQNAHGGSPVATSTPREAVDESSLLPPLRPALAGDVLNGERDVSVIDGLPGVPRPVLTPAVVTPLPLPAAAAQDLGLRDAEVVQGLVEVRGETLKLVINGKAVDLPPGTRYVAGDQPWFTAMVTNDGVALKPTAAPTTMAGAPVAASLPVPAPLIALLARSLDGGALTQLFTGPTLAQAFAAADLSGLASSFRTARLATTRVTPERVKNAVMASGLQFESQLAEGRAPAAADMKMALQRLLANLPEQSAVRATAQQALDDVSAAQLQAVQAQNQQELFVNVVLPFSDANPVRLTFSRARRTREQPDPPTVIDVHTHHPRLGEVWLKSSVQSARDIDLTMWAMKPEVATAAAANSPALGRELKAAGLVMKQFVVYNAARPDGPRPPVAPGGLINVEA